MISLEAITWALTHLPPSPGGGQGFNRVGHLVLQVWACLFLASHEGLSRSCQQLLRHVGYLFHELHIPHPSVVCV